MWNLQLAWYDSIALLGMLLITLILLLKAPHDNQAEIEADDTLVGKSRAFFWLLFGLLVLIVSAKALVWGAASIAATLGVSDLVIGLTIIAIGTSLPELAASIASALKGHADIALGNVLGSNLFNLCLVLAVPGFVTTIAIDPEALSRDYTVSLVLTLLLALCCVAVFKGKIRRWQGGCFLSLYIAYLALLQAA